jgi:hypothetical protein
MSAQTKTDLEERGETVARVKRGMSPLVTMLGILVCIGVGIGVGIGIGAGIWKKSGEVTNEANLRATCPEGKHNSALNTYFLSTSSVNVSELPDIYNPAFGDFLGITIPKSSFPPTIPFVKTSMIDGQVFQDVLNSTDFFDMWSELSKKASPDNGTFAMPGLDEAHWCLQQYQDQFDPLASGKGIKEAPPNAMIVFDSDSRDTFVADIFSVQKETDTYTLHARLAPTNASLDVKEGLCHSHQSVLDPHYHHRSRCLAIETAEVLNSAASIDGKGMTAFIKVS